LPEAIALAAELAELGDDYKEVSYPKIKKEFWEEILVGLQTQASLDLPEVLVGKKFTAKEKKVLRSLEEYRLLLQAREPLARLPYLITN